MAITESRAELQALVAGDDLPDLESLLSRPWWHALAACRGAPVDLFFIERGGDPRPAKALCVDCPVRGECLAAAVEGDEVGTWGGVTERARRRGDVA